MMDILQLAIEKVTDPSVGAEILEELYSLAYNQYENDFLYWIHV